MLVKIDVLTADCGFLQKKTIVRRVADCGCINTDDLVQPSRQTRHSNPDCSGLWPPMEMYYTSILPMNNIRDCLDAVFRFAPSLFHSLQLTFPAAMKPRISAVTLSPLLGIY